MVPFLNKIFGYFNVPFCSKTDDFVYCPDLVSRLLIKDPERISQDYRQIINSIKLPAWEKPLVSIIVCAHNKLSYTLNCLYSLSKFQNETSFEVILVDDQSTDESPEILPKIENLRYYFNEQNLGFLRSANLGADKARGEYLVFLNNDTVVMDHWLDNLIRFLIDNSGIGLVGSKLLYPDGRLQEAGSFVFSSGDAWNYGGGQEPSDNKYNFPREVDYCSGASLAIRSILFFRLGMFDERYVPIYYEDVDLALKVREVGLKVYYINTSRIYHFEGVTNGRNLEMGVKKYQTINREKFIVKWEHLLIHQPGDLIEAEERWGIIDKVHYSHKADFTYCNDIVSRLLIKDLGIDKQEYKQIAKEIKLPVWDKPLVSIVVCAHNELNYTLNCLYSLSQFKNQTSFEVVLVDDQSTDKSPVILPQIGNLKYYFNQQNLGFLRSANIGALRAQGDYLVFLNNDTIVTDHWLDSLIEFLEKDKKIGLVGSKLIYPDGMLQEAGAVIFANGSTWNCSGSGGLLNKCFDFPREVDYCSGASLAIRSDLFIKLGMFDEFFLPCYYEDVDLALRVKQAGLKVYYVNNSVAYHFEGISHGRNLKSGVKKYQFINKEKFINKWKHVLFKQLRSESEARTMIYYKGLTGINHSLFPTNYNQDEASVFDGLEVDSDLGKDKNIEEKASSFNLEAETYGQLALITTSENIVLEKKIIDLCLSVSHEEYLNREAWKTIRELEKTINIYSSSLSWKITEPLRATHSLLMRFLKYIKIDFLPNLLSKNKKSIYHLSDKAGRDVPGFKKRILVVDHYVPNFDRDAGSMRMFNLLKILVDLDYRVVFWGNDYLSPEPYTTILRQLGVEIYSEQPMSFKKYLSLEGKNFDVVLLSRPHIAKRHLVNVRKYCFNSMIIYDTVDLVYLRQSRQAQIENNKGLNVLALESKELEYKLALGSDMTFVVSENERKIMHEEHPELSIEIVPTIYEIAPKSNVSFSQKHGIFFIGGFSHLPNVDAVKYFVSEIFPLIEKKIPGVIFYVIGSNPPEEILKLGRQNILITGYIPDVSFYFEHCRVSVAPMRYGAGVKGKINHSMSYGIPTVTTSVGAEGMNLVDNLDILIANDPSSFASKVVSLYQDEKLWEVISKNSLENVKKYYQYGVVKNNLKEILDKLLSRK